MLYSAHNMPREPSVLVLIYSVPNNNTLPFSTFLHTLRRCELNGRTQRRTFTTLPKQGNENIE